MLYPAWSRFCANGGCFLYWILASIRWKWRPWWLQPSLLAVSEPFFGPPLTVVALGHAQPIPLFRQLARSDSSGRDDVGAVPTVAAKRRGPLGRTRDRHQP